METIAELTPQQEQMILDLWNSDPEHPPLLKDLTEKIFGPGFDGRSTQSRAIRIALAKHNLVAKTLSQHNSKTDKIELTEAHVKYIENNITTMNPLEIAKILFSNHALTNLHAETRAVTEQVRKMSHRVLYSKTTVDDVPKEAQYKPPTNLDQCWNRINQYITFAPERSKITAEQKRCVDVLIGYLHTFRFIAQMNNYETESERKICEDAFIRSTYDKTDLQQEEVDQYIEYANHVVQGFNIQRRSNKLQSSLENISGNSPEDMKISMSLVEAIGKASTEFNMCKKREQDLLEDLKGKRSERLTNQISSNASVLNLIQLWRNEETRNDLEQHAAKEQALISEEVDKLSSMSELKARIMGLTKNEIKYG
jgi:hypothetical protein